MAEFLAGQIPTAQMFSDAVLIGTVVAQLRQTSAQSIPNVTPTALTFDTEDYDVLGGHSTVSNTSRYTCQREGWYLLLGGVGFATSAGGNYRGCQWRQNGSQLNAGQQLIPRISTVQTIVAARSYMVYLVVPDYIELFAEQDSGGALNTFVTNVGQSNIQVMYAGLPN